MATTYVDQISGSGSSPTPVDQITGGGETVAYKAPCRLATTGNVTLDGLQTIDGQMTAAGDRVLVKAQTDQKQNGIWIAAAGAWSRARDFDSNRDITKGTRVTVTDGSTLAGKEYQITSPNPITVGTSNVTFAETLSSDAGSSAAAAEAARDIAIAKADLTAADALATAADRTQTGLDVIATAADRVQTWLDADATAADRVQTGLDRVATGNDAIATAADRVQTGIDRAAAEAAAESVGFTKDNDGTMAANSDAVVPSQKAVVTYIAAAIAALRNGVSAAFDTLAEIATELNLKAPLNSPALTGNPTAPTQTQGDNSTRIATTAYVRSAISAVLNGVSSAFDTLAEIATELALKAPVNSPALTGTPTAPTATAGTNTTQIATTAFVLANGGGGTTYGAVGTYVQGYIRNTGITEDTSYAGSLIEPGGLHADSDPADDGFTGTVSISKGGSALSGTWRAMGRQHGSSGNLRARLTLFVRIA